MIPTLGFVAADLTVQIILNDLRPGAGPDQSKAEAPGLYLIRIFGSETRPA